MKLKLLIIIYLVLGACHQNTPNVYQFENGINKNINTENSIMSISEHIARDGNHSLKWDYNSNSTLNIMGKIKFKPFVPNNISQNRDNFVLWIYNPLSNTNSLKIQFYKNNKLKTHFVFKLNYQGWRTAWVKYEGDMTGTPEEGMDKITIISPPHKGILYFDQIIPIAHIDPRFGTRDNQVPFVNKMADTGPNAHWIGRYMQYHQYQKYTKNINNTINKKNLQNIKTINDRYMAIFLTTTATNKQFIEQLHSLQQQYLQKSIDYKYRQKSFSQLDFHEKELAQDYIELKKVGHLMLTIAKTYNNTTNSKDKQILAKMYLQLFQHLRDSGWDIGSGQGTLSHLGYSIRELGQSFLLMKDILQKNQLSELVSNWLAWFNGLGMIFAPTQEIKGTNVDILNTLLNNMVISALINPHVGVQNYILLQIKKYLDYGIIHSPGLAGGFKSDGAGFHHQQHYPAYTQDSFKGLAPLLYAFSKTPFALSKEAHQITKKVLLTLRASANTHDFLLSISGRHPNNKIKLLATPYRYYALAGDPEGRNDIDIEMMRAYLRLDTQSSYAKKFLKQGFTPETSPQGTWTINMASLQLHRQKDWLVAMRGFSRYLVGNETYSANNLFGRYMNYGHFQFLQNNAQDSGFIQEGFDWNHIAGTTTINLPLELLKSDIRQVDSYSGIEEMLLSDEVFSGGNSLENTGIFAMKLHEHPKYNGSHRARKSAFFFDDTVIFLGTDITNDNQHYETHTTLFQNYLGDNTHNTIQTNNNHALYIKDIVGNLYYIPQNLLQNLIYHSGLQYSKDQATGIPTEGNFELAYINHGKSPHNQHYEYALLIQGTEDRINEFLHNPGYHIIQQNSKAHIIEDTSDHIYFYVFFEPQQLVEDHFISSVDVASTVIIKPMEKQLKISFANPDLSLYHGRDQSQYDKNGIMKEVSIYSRTWKTNESIPLTNNMIIHGIWKIWKEKEFDTNIQLSYPTKNTTQIRFITQYGTPIALTLNLK